jgi:hypothetical protein
VHRTTTTATLLVTVAAVSVAVSGCTTVQRPPSPGIPSAPTPISEPRPDGSAEPQVVQAPAREALELIGPSRRPSAPTSTPRRTVPSAPAAAQADTPRHTPAEPPRRPEPQRPDQRTVPRLPTHAAPVKTDVCALGRKYGGWNEDSPEAVICEDTYGR